MAGAVSLFVALGCAFLVQLGQVDSSLPPNIVFIVADDLGFADIGFRNPYFSTPYLDQLAKEGVILNQSYVQPVCTPSRNSWMSGLYPFKTGLQHIVINPPKPECLPLKHKLLPQYLKELGYATHMVGKWHLGFCNWNCTPTYRGFDSFYGYYNGMEHYFNHSRDGYLDFRSNEQPEKSGQGIYSANLFAAKAETVIRKHNTTQPLFLYLPFQSVHSPIEVPEYYADKCPGIKDNARRHFCGMVAALDEAVMNVTQALQDSGMYDNTIIIFTTDNGGIQALGGSGYNYPLRGQKATIWEGGTRGTGFVHSRLLKKTGYTSNGMLHATDWFSTIIGLAGGEAPSGVDGIDQSDLILNGGDSKRTEFIYNIDTIRDLHNVGAGGIRMGDYKLMIGPPGIISFGRWFVPPEYQQHIGVKQAAEGVGEEDTSEQLYLFNVKDDPDERTNLYHQMPDQVTKMKARLDYYQQQMVPAQNPPPDPNSNPEKYGGVWSPGWC